MYNNTINANEDFLFFNRVPKAGSEQLIELIRRLQKNNGFSFSRTTFAEPVYVRLFKKKQKELIETLMAKETPHAFAMHVNYIDFRKHDLPQPIYINLIRDPVERIISWFYYKRTPWSAVQMYKVRKTFNRIQWYKKNFEECVLSDDNECKYIPYSGFANSIPDHRRQTLFFCGHDHQCEPFNTKEAMQLAKQNVEREYAVVGSWEDVNVTLQVFEQYIPKYFKGATMLYYDTRTKGGLASSPRNTNHWKPKTSEKIKTILRANFTMEYEFYHFCKQRLYTQYFALKNIEQ